MNTLYYRSCVAVGKFLFWNCVRLHLIRPEITDRPGPYILALTHLGNVDPFCSSVLVRRHIRWMARKEFFRFRPFAWFLRKMGAFSVNRQGIPVSAIRRAIELARTGEVVGICPEGGRAMGKAAAFRGGKIKKGVCSVAIRSGVPIVPCVMLGTPDMNRVGPWLPSKRAKLWVAYGEPLTPPTGKSTRAKREQLREQISAAYIRLYEELRHQFGLEDAAVP
ncbi:MAG: 1-acyl-sn-glycerol-3-phosphate acyltransferase [Phycisphaerales bacterium]|jgi:1-acyl-sn-glycerol-3-phosphate acyltransferase|nr:1-acyl-sn-glycerol-3-phosphate acyltransferase [Phycisphaerales bacterium]MEA2735094.1 1-acyl-sn-glycerol-3-phosphate acyltransferase [Humisphaera sp.]